MTLSQLSKRLTSHIGWLTLWVLCCVPWAMPSPASATITTASFSKHITGETIGVTSTTISYTLDVISNIEIDIYRLQDVSDVPGPNNQVAGLPQTGVSSGTHNVSWDALWPVGGDIGRQNGLFKIIITDLADNSTFAISSFLQITSVDIHSVSVSPSFDGAHHPAFPYIINYSLAKASNVTVLIKNSANTTIRTLKLNDPQYGEEISTNRLTWNGLDDIGHPVGLGIYTITIDATDTVTSDTAITRTKTATVQSLASLDADPQQVFDTNTFIYPNPVRASRSDTLCGHPACFQMLAVRDNASLSYRIYSLAGDLVKEDRVDGLPTATFINFLWDATNQAGKKVGRGLYYVVFREQDAGGTIQIVRKMAVIQ